jgi:FtsH-binding integral membrane protein
MYRDEQSPYGHGPAAVATLGVEARATFIQRTYAHLLGAIVAFVALEVALFQSGIAQSILDVAMRTNWLLFLGAFMLVGFLATRAAMNAKTLGAQYAGLGLYVLAEAVIFAPILYIADTHAPGVISSAALVTLVGFSALTAIVFVTRKDFSFLRGVLIWGSIAALGLIVLSALGAIGGLGTVFTVAMIAVAGAWILYDTSNVLHHYPEERYVGAALALFASVALLFWYVLRLFMSRE